MKQNYIIPIFLPFQGCKYKCIFCSQNNIVQKETELNISNKIEEYLSSIPQSVKKVEVAFYGGTFTGLDINYQEELLKQVIPYIKNSKIYGIRISTRPDAINSSEIQLLKSYYVKTIELGIQSLSNKVLKNIERGYTVKDVSFAVRLLKENGMQVGLQMMIGLPGESIYTLKKSIKKVCKLKPDFVRIHPTLVLKETELEKLYADGKYKPLTMRQTINRCLIYLEEMQKENIKVTRLGLYPSPELLINGVVIAGPFHPALRDIVESEKFYRLITAKLDKKIYKNKILYIQINKNDASYIRGQKRSNIIRLKNRYKFKEIIIIESLEIDKGTIQLEIKSSERKNYENI